MNRAARMKRIEDAEKVIERLVELGWQPESMAYTDAENEPFRFTLTMRAPRDSAVGEEPL